MRPLFTASLLTFLTVHVTALFYDSSILAARQPNAKNDCNATCGSLTVLRQQCVGSSCGCTIQYLQTQGNCLICQSQTPMDAASVQIQLDAQISQCHSEGFDVDFQLTLPPGTAAIVQKLSQLNKQLKQEQTLFLALQIAGGHVGLVLILLFSIFSQKVHRDPTFFNFCITWIFSSVVFSILLYSGTEGHTVVQTLGIVTPNQCLGQAALTNGAQVMTACSTMALVIQLWFSLRFAIHGKLLPGIKQTRWSKITLLAMPYVLFSALTLLSIFHISVQGMSIERALPTNLYCMVVVLDPLLQAVYGVTLGLLLITVAFDVLIIKILFYHWRVFRHAPDKSPVSLSILLRVIIFSIYRIVVVVAYGTILRKPPKMGTEALGASSTSYSIFGVPAWVDMLQAATPLVGFLVFGINGDIINALMFWRKEQPVSKREPSSVHLSGISPISGHSVWNEQTILERTRSLELSRTQSP